MLPFKKKPASSATKAESEAKTTGSSKTTRKTMGNVIGKQAPPTSDPEQQQSSSAPKPTSTTAVPPSVRIGKQSAAVASSSQPSTQTSAKVVKQSNVAPKQKSQPKKKFPAVRNEDEISTKKMARPPVTERQQEAEEDDILEEPVKKAASGKKPKPAGKNQAAVDAEPSTSQASRNLPLSGSKKSTTSEQQKGSSQPSSSKQPVASSSSQPRKRKSRITIVPRPEPSSQPKFVIRQPKIQRKKIKKRYVGPDVFGNYHILLPEQVLEIVMKVRPQSRTLLEDIEELTLSINHYLEDFLVVLCEDTNQPYGFVTFQQLMGLLRRQKLIPDDMTSEGLMNLMKEKMSDDDWNRSYGILYPKKHSYYHNNDNYFG